MMTSDMGNVVKFVKSLSRTRKIVAGFFIISLLTTIIVSTHTTPTTTAALVTGHVLGASTTQSSQTTATVENKTIATTEIVGYQSYEVGDSGLPVGERRVTTYGQPGEKVTLYRVTLVNGKETKRELTDEHISKYPVDEVTNVGTATATSMLSHGRIPIQAATVAPTQVSGSTIAISNTPPPPTVCGPTDTSAACTPSSNTPTDPSSTAIDCPANGSPSTTSANGAPVLSGLDLFTANSCATKPSSPNQQS